MENEENNINNWPLNLQAKWAISMMLEHFRDGLSLSGDEIDDVELILSKIEASHET